MTTSRKDRPPPRGEGPAIYTIAELAEAFSITHRTLRFYEDKGMLKPRRVGNRRLYTNRDRRRLRIILDGKQVGLTLREIQEFLDTYDLRDGSYDHLRRALDKVHHQRHLLQQRRAAIETSLNELARVEQIIEGMLAEPQDPDGQGDKI
ncbi:MerR family transcriptional regulator [Pelagibacterium montanilacus]|uniref:MerR family transcriptional regulator n=1 Tax=Pelagibacterium montanilacus TaxID=2185280 RepID=UPI000F8E190F|nr:MerR family transcriptional regulator [Pelagibacterium montanilacus]